MDKHEFNIKVDQIKKMVSKGDFEMAMKIADTIDWRRVRNANLLSMISSVYEKNAEYQEAKDILLIAFERAPIGKRLLYKLTQLALKEGEIAEAESYYREFCEMAGDDSRQDILRYLILKAKGAPIEQLIHSLESYTSIELDEKWLYELADLYHQAGKEEECVKTCDKIMLMFGLGQYVDKAMELKLQYAPLTKYQMDLVENRDKYEEKLRQVEQNGINAVVSQDEMVSKEEAEQAAAARRGQVAAMEARAAAQPPVSSYADALSPSSVSSYAGVVSQPSIPTYPAADTRPAVGYVPSSVQPPVSSYVEAGTQPPVPSYAEANAQPPASSYAEANAQPPVSSYAGANAQPPASYVAATAEPPVSSYTKSEVQPPVSAYPGTEELPSESREVREQEKEEEMVSNIAASFAAATAESQGAPVSPEEKLEVSMKEAEVEASLAEEMSKISMDSYREEPVREKTRVLQNVKDLKKAGEQPEKTRVLKEIRHIQAVKQAEEPKPHFNHLMVESQSPEKGLEIAVESLKKAHQILTYKHAAAKISGEKLNQKGILASASKLSAKDLIIENAGDLCDAMLEELDKLLAEDKSQMLVVLVDNTRQLEGIRRISPSLAEKFHVVVSVEDAEKVFICGAEWQKSAVKENVSIQETAAARQTAYREETAAVQRTVSRAEAAVTQQTVSRTEAAATRQTVATARTAAEPVRQTETVPVRRETPKTEAVPVRQAASVRQTSSRTEAAPAHPAASRTETAPVRQTISRTEAAPVRQTVSRTESVSVRQDIPRTESAPGRQVFPRTETAGNIVQLRNTPDAYSNKEMAEQGRNAVDEPDDGRIMDLDEFAQYCCHYASQIDCNISGKSMLALYERIEIMEEEGIALTKTAAEDLIEEAADRAEKPSLGKRITGLFSSKYDKEGLLILKEEHFI